MESSLEFEKPIITLEKKLQDLRDLEKQEKVNLSKEIKVLEAKVIQLIDDIFAKLTPWEKVQLSRHPNRPHASDYIENLFPTFDELHGDRGFGDDRALVAGFAQWPPSGAQKKSIAEFPILILAQQKGRSTKQKLERNFGMAKPEGYRKAIRLMELAERTKTPILTFIDTPGAYPGIETEERGQAQAIAECLRVGFDLTVPVMSVVIGEGGSGGALAIGVANKVLMMEYSKYSVISPEGCASILWSDSRMAEMASSVLKMSPEDLLDLGVIDGVIPEPKGGAHRNWDETFTHMRNSLIEHFESMILHVKPKPKSFRPLGNPKVWDTYDFRGQRIQKFRKMGLQALGQMK